jgi:hypothetical protein
LDFGVGSNIISLVGSYIPMDLKVVKVVMEEVVSFWWTIFLLFLFFPFEFDGYCSISSIFLGVF